MSRYESKTIRGKNNQHLKFCARLSWESHKLLFYGNIDLSLRLYVDILPVPLWPDTRLSISIWQPVYFFYFTVYPAFEMTNPGPIINGRRHQEGYITDYPVSTIPALAGSGGTNDKIVVEIDGLPVTAAVTLEFEKLSMDLSTHPRFEIGVRLAKFSSTKLVYNASTMDNDTET